MSSEPGYEPLRILVTGWRHWPEEHRGVVWDALEAVRKGWLPSIRAEVKRLNREPPNPIRGYWFERSVIVRHGQCPYGGADLWADQWAVRFHHLADRHPMDRFYSKAGGWRAAGPLRNTWMVEYGPTPDVCVAFPGPGSTGTWDCIRKAARKGIEVVIVGFGDRPYDKATPRSPIQWPPSNMDTLTKDING
jgi:hypothetical protein